VFWVVSASSEKSPRVDARRFGSGVDRIDVLDASPENPRGTIVADLADGANLASNTYDCIICLQTLLLLIYDIKAAIGTALGTVPGISQICRPDLDSCGDYWRFTHEVGTTAVRGGLRARERHS
jgi:hypothetical protein